MKFLKLICCCAAVGVAGCAQKFEVKPLTVDEQQFEKTLLAESNSDSRLALGQLYFTNNRIDEAHALLSQVVGAEPRNAMALAWHGANNCKIAGRKGPWLMGLDKLYLVQQCLNQIDAALAMAPDDFTVQMIHMNTGVEVNRFGALERAQQTKARVEARFAAAPSALPADALAQFYVTAARLERVSGNAGNARAYLDKASVLHSTPTTRYSIEAENREKSALR
jgi:tetratricopeptide (TPR) repeat protein